MSCRKILHKYTSQKGVMEIFIPFYLTNPHFKPPLLNFKQYKLPFRPKKIRLLDNVILFIHPFYHEHLITFELSNPFPQRDFIP
jgi:hypothetical protein